jgi:AcrR family transcriptional regulator
MNISEHVADADMTVKQFERKDVARNRAKLLQAAEELVAEYGLDLSFNQIARHAGVGVGTVYRHFADRDELIAGLTAQRLERAKAIMLAALQDDDPVAALRRVILSICELQAADRGIWQALTATGQSHAEVLRQGLLPLTSQLVERARVTGRVRPDITATDLPMILWIGGALGEYAGDVGPGLWRRYVEILLNGLCEPADATPPLTVEALTDEDLARFMVNPPARSATRRL